MTTPLRRSAPLCLLLVLLGGLAACERTERKTDRLPGMGSSSLERPAPGMPMRPVGERQAPARVQALTRPDPAAAAG